MNADLMQRRRGLAMAFITVCALAGCTRQGDVAPTAADAETAARAAEPADPLPSWDNGAAKQAIVAFVASVTDSKSKSFVRAEQRIAVFDNDGTLWGEQPLYFQVFFALDRIRAMAEQHPEWRTTEPFKSAIAGDLKGLMASGQEGIFKVLVATHANVSTEEFEQSVRDWLVHSTHPTTGKPFTEMVYQPMLELLQYLRANDFKTFIVSGGGVDFMRVFAEETYGVPPEQVVGSTIDAEFQMRNGVPTIIKTGKIVLVDDKAGKPVGIHRHIGRRPIFAAGNSDGDLQMLQYATIPRSRSDATPSMGVIVHHTDADREFAYDRNSSIGRLDKALDEAQQRNWVVVDMRGDWNQIYPAAATQAGPDGQEAK